MQTVGIIGLGLIGGSIGLALKYQNSKAGDHIYTVIGYDSDPRRREQAEQAQVVDQISEHLFAVVRQADLLVIATPALAVRQVLAEIASHARAETVITDTASTKAAVLRWAAELLPAGARFIGGHPMAGGTGSLEDARADLFYGATYCLVPTMRADAVSQADESALAALRDLIAALGARPLLIDATTHDRCVAAISHLPFLISTALVETMANSPEVEIMSRLASSGFRDTTRLAAGDPIMYQQIALTNREAIAFWLDTHIAELQTIRQMLQADSDAGAERLLALFTRARERRKRLLG